MTCRLGIDLGGSKTEVVVLDGDNQVVFRHRVVTPAQHYESILDCIASLVEAAEKTLPMRATIGIGTPGAISAKTGLLRNSNTQCLNGRPFKADLEVRLGREIKFENDANCFTLSESQVGVAVGFGVVFGVIIGTGTGGGLVVDGRLISGRHAIAGEWGHNPLPWLREDDGCLDCYCGKRGCIETFLCGPGMSQGFESRFGQSRSSEAIARLAEVGDRDGIEMLDIYCDQMARALAHVINIIDPDAIVLGGGLSNMNSIYAKVPLLLEQYVFADFVATPLIQAGLGDASGVFGAAMLWDRKNKPVE
ncbi:MAG: fructokinase [Planctomycetota bacterium]|jgi:fructokinase